MATKVKLAPLLVTTAHRGVFFGYGSIDPEKKTIVLKDAQLVVYWSADCKGFMGLTTSGPTANCKIGVPAPEILLFDVTSISSVSKEAAEKFKKAPWR